MTVDAAGFRRLTHLDEAWRHANAGTRLDAVRRAAPALHDAIRASGMPAGVVTFENATVPYPTRFALGGACLLPLPYIVFKNRTQIVRWRDGGRTVTLLVNPTDPERSRRAPFFARQARMAGEFLSTKVLSKMGAPAPEQVAGHGVDPRAVDYVTFDHLHVQDLRRVLGSATDPGWFPNARLLVQRAELGIFERIHPLQSPWFIPEALDGVDPTRLIALDGDHLLGPGVAIVRTPGHTAGNHTICLHTPDGLWTISENGVGPDNYAPEASSIPGLARHAAAYGVEVVLNANTREQSLDQYTSMVLEKSLASRVDGTPFPRHFSSSEMTASALAPGLRPTLAFGSIQHGSLAG